MRTTLKKLTGLALLASSLGLAAAGPAPKPAQPNGTVVTACGNTYTYNSDNVGVVNRSADGQTTSTVYVDGKAVLTETCPSGGGGNGPGGPTPPRPTPPTRPTPPRGPNQLRLNNLF